MGFLLSARARVYHQAVCLRDARRFVNMCTKQEPSPQMSEGKADELEKPNTPVGGASDPNARVTMKGCNQRGRGSVGGIANEAPAGEHASGIEVCVWLTSSRPSRSAAWWGTEEWELTPPPGGQSTPSCPSLDEGFWLCWTARSCLKQYNVLCCYLPPSLGGCVVLRATL